MIEARATARFVRTSAQKAGLVLDLIRGKDVNKALATLQYSRKAVARDIAKVLRSAIANAEQKDGFGGDVDQLYVKACYANQGPSFKRVRPAPMGRAFRVVKRTTHLTVQVTERPQQASAPAPRAGGAAAKKPAGPPKKAAGAAKKTAGTTKKAAGTAKKAPGARKAAAGKARG
jgi:large subunit ribosomal protein L22